MNKSSNFVYDNKIKMLTIVILVICSIVAAIIYPNSRKYKTITEQLESIVIENDTAYIVFIDDDKIYEAIKHTGVDLEILKTIPKKTQVTITIEDQSKETFSKNQEESIITRNEHNVYKKIFDFKSSVLVEISNISLKIPIQPKEAKCVSFNLDSSLVFRMKTDSKIETDEISYFNYINRNIHTSLLISNVVLGIEEFVDNETIKYDIINDFRISARSDDILVVNSKNSIIQSYVNMWYNEGIL